MELPPDFPSRPQPPQSPQQIGAAAAAQAAQAYTLATQAYALDQRDFDDPSYRPPTDEKPSAGAGTSRPTESASAQPTHPAITAPADNFPADLLQTARELGITDQEARSYGDPAVLQRVVNFAARQRRPQAKVTPQAPVEPDLPTLPSWRDMVFPAGAVDEAGRSIAGQPYFDPKLVEVMEARDQLLLSVVEENRQLKAGLGQVGKAAAQSQAETRNQRYDQAFAAVPAEYKEAIGEGTYHGMDEDGAQFQTRNEIVLSAEGMEHAYRQAGKQPPPFRTLFERALRAVCGGQVKQQVEKQVAQRARDATGQHIARPTQSRNGSPAAPPTQAEFDRQNVNRLQQRMTALGWDQN